MNPRSSAHLSAVTGAPDPGPQAKVARTVPALSGEVAGLRRAVVGLGRTAGLDDGRLAEVALAVGEACANAVVHAYTDREPGLMRVTAHLTPDGLEVVVVDDGRGMTPRTDSPGLGLGLSLMSSLSTTLDLKAPPGGGTEIRMVFAPSPRDAERASWACTG